MLEQIKDACKLYHVLTAFASTHYVCGRTEALQTIVRYLNALGITATPADVEEMIPEALEELRKLHGMVADLVIFCKTETSLPQWRERFLDVYETLRPFDAELADEFLTVEVEDMLDAKIFSENILREVNRWFLA